MKHSIVQFNASNSSVIRNGQKDCDLCGEKNLTESFGILTRIGEDVDVFEFSPNVWDLCRACVSVEHKANADRYHTNIKYN